MSIDSKQTIILNSLKAAHTDIAEWYENVVLLMDAQDSPFVCLQKIATESVPNGNMDKRDTFYAPGKPKLDEYQFALCVGACIDSLDENDDPMFGDGNETAATLKECEAWVSEKLESILQSVYLILQSRIEYSYDYVGNGNRKAFFASCLVNSTTR